MIPALRFSKFKSEYLPKIIDEIAKVTSGGTPSRAKADYWNGHIPWVTTSQINFKDITAADEYITDLGLKKSSAKLFPKGTILLALYGQGITRGRVSVLEIEATTNQACAAIILESEDVNTRFTFYYLQSKYEDIRNLANDGGQKNLSGGLVKSLSVVLPSDVMEQAEVADFLTSVDTKISQLNEKHCLLKDYKKGVMQQIFRQQIRFKDDDGNAFPEWEEKLLGDIATFTKGKSISKADISIDGITPCIRYGELYTTYGEVIESVVSATSLPIKSLLFSKANDVIVPSSGETQWDIATAACVKLSGVAYSGDLTVIRTPLNGVFLSYYFNSAKKREIASLSQGSSVIHLYSTHLKSLKVEIPCEAEQQKIAQFLQSLDKKINAVNEQIEQTKLFKKGLLQQMFV
ncbi:restriction endonuclease subunit S [Vibrio casei]|uniref:Restriction endonuclease subunit S n=2 Tax=Gammaproteobacteria TaxID=1236 RepID=A0A368LG39_9VIBR|nr:restriction endonuclease subunit S [Vibrio casei]RCS68732.1 restriction endonuclease subunit S [Vibrio casei]SJN33325.1 Type I restriction-modification system, specificity subunit S [Vibrio casei]